MNLYVNIIDLVIIILAIYFWQITLVLVLGAFCLYFIICVIKCLLNNKKIEKVFHNIIDFITSPQILRIYDNICGYYQMFTAKQIGLKIIVLFTWAIVLFLLLSIAFLL